MQQLLHRQYDYLLGVRIHNDVQKIDSSTKYEFGILARVGIDGLWIIMIRREVVATCFIKKNVPEAAIQAMTHVAA